MFGEAGSDDAGVMGDGYRPSLDQSSLVGCSIFFIYTGSTRIRAFVFPPSPQAVRSML